ncbi:MAG: hypothetical protein J5817_03350, partial [Treponema sp.]|nr:hypothetical protein [Treponema sp.]
MRNAAVQIHWKVVFLTSIIAATVLTLFSACSNPNSDSWEEPVHDYFDKYTNTAAIEKQEIRFQTQKDKSGTTCIPSDGNKTVTFYLRNPRQYTLNLETSFSVPDSGADIQIEQDMQDKTIIRLTYPQSYLQAHDGGQQIGGTIYLTESETLRKFDPYSFSLKCNSPPPGVKGQSVQSNGSNYIVCFYVPTTELGNAPHNLDTHTVCINGEAVATIGTDGSITPIPGKIIYTTAPSELNVIPGSGASEFTGNSAGCTALYYDTGHLSSSGEFIRWNIYLEDDDGFKSETVNADSIVTQVNLSILGNDILTLNTETAENSSLLTAQVDSGAISSCTWEPSSSSIITISPDSSDNGKTATVMASAGGTENITITATLADGREVTTTKTVRVLAVNFADDTPEDFLK